MIRSYNNDDNMVLVDNPNIDLFSYDYIIVAFSGGKDSLACILRLLDLGVPREKIELWHHLVDGVGPIFFDWTVTRAYIKAVADALQLPVYFSWRDEGFLGELLKHNERSHRMYFETPEGIKYYDPVKASISTRRMFPMIANDIERRWCTSVLKIEEGRIALSHQQRFVDHKTLMITGERAQESNMRAGYNVFEIHKMDSRDSRKEGHRRYIDALRLVHPWLLEDVWRIIERYRINPHPCYRLGFGRCSCACCIFSDPAQIASFKIACPGQYQAVLQKERELQTIHYRKIKGDFVSYDLDAWVEFARQGGMKHKDGTLVDATPFTMKASDIRAINSTEFNEPIILDKWVRPPGALSTAHAAGPT